MEISGKLFKFDSDKGQDEVDRRKNGDSKSGKVAEFDKKMLRNKIFCFW